MRLRRLRLHLATLSHADFDAEQCYVGEAHVTKNWEWPPANSKLGNEAFNLTALMDLNPVNSHWVSWKAYPPPERSSSVAL